MGRKEDNPLTKFFRSFQYVRSLISPSLRKNTRGKISWTDLRPQCPWHFRISVSYLDIASQEIHLRALMLAIRTRSFKETRTIDLAVIFNYFTVNKQRDREKDHRETITTRLTARRFARISTASLVLWPSRCGSGCWLTIVSVMFMMCRVTVVRVNNCPHHGHQTSRR